MSDEKIYNLGGIDALIAELVKDRDWWQKLKDRALSLDLHNKAHKLLINKISSEVTSLQELIDEALPLRGKFDPEVRAYLGLALDASDEEVRQELIDTPERRLLMNEAVDAALYKISAHRTSLMAQIELTNRHLADNPPNASALREVAARMDLEVKEIDKRVNQLLEGRGSMEGEVKAILGLAPDATDEQILTAIEDLKAKVGEGGEQEEKVD
jgi:hypothetical protein